MVSVSRNLDDTSHRHLMFLMASIFAQLFKSESVLWLSMNVLIINYLQWILEEIYRSADFMGIS